MRLLTSRPVVGAICLTLGIVATAGASKLLTGKDIMDGSIQIKDLSKKARQELRGETGPIGPKGDPGARGEPGAPGSPAPAILEGAILASAGPASAFAAPEGGLKGVEGEVSAPVPAGAAITARDLFATSSVSPGGVGTGYLVALRVDGTNALSCKIEGSNKSCTSGNAEVVLSPGQKLSMRIESDASTPNSYIGWGIRLVP